jgi:hypothetical protein
VQVQDHSVCHLQASQFNPTMTTLPDNKYAVPIGQGYAVHAQFSGNTKPLLVGYIVPGPKGLVSGIQFDSPDIPSAVYILDARCPLLADTIRDYLGDCLSELDYLHFFNTLPDQIKRASIKIVPIMARDANGDATEGVHYEITVRALFK